MKRRLVQNVGRETHWSQEIIPSLPGNVARFPIVVAGGLDLELRNVKDLVVVAR